MAAYQRHWPEVWAGFVGLCCFGVNETGGVKGYAERASEASGSCRLRACRDAALAAQLAGGLELAVTLGPGGGAATGQEVGRGDVPERAVQPDGVARLDEAGDEGPGLLKRGGLAGADSADLQGLVPALDLAARLRVVVNRPRGSSVLADQSRTKSTT